MNERILKNGIVRVSTEFLTEVIITAAQGRVPADAIATGVYYDPQSDSFAFVISSEILPPRDELDNIVDVAGLTKADLASFFEGFTGRAWGRPMKADEFVSQGREVLRDFEKGEATDRELKSILKLIVEHFEDDDELVEGGNS
jgi:hypothetical protein